MLIQSRRLVISGWPGRLIAGSWEMAEMGRFGFVIFAKRGMRNGDWVNIHERFEFSLMCISNYGFALLCPALW